MKMTDIEKKLAEYRTKKASGEITKAPRKLLAFFSKKKENDKESKEKLLGDSVDEPDAKTLILNETDVASDTGSDLEDLPDCCTYTDLIYYALWLVLWAILWSIFIKLQFGTVYFITSGLVGIYLNTRTGPKSKNEISAYSVFNKDCKSIDGTLKAEQFEREIRYGPSSVH